MSDRTFKKSPTAFLLNRLSHNKLIQEGSKNRYVKTIEYFRDDTEPNLNGEKTPVHPQIDPKTWGEGTSFHGNNQGFDVDVDKNNENINSTDPVKTKFSSNATLRVATPGFRENDSTYHDYIVNFVNTHQGLTASEGLSNPYVKVLKGETRSLTTTFIKVSGGTKPIMYVYKGDAVRLALLSTAGGSIYKYIIRDSSLDTTKGSTPMYGWHQEGEVENHYWTDTLNIVTGQSDTKIWINLSGTWSTINDIYVSYVSGGGQFYYYVSTSTGTAPAPDVTGWSTTASGAASIYTKSYSLNNKYYYAVAGDDIYSDASVSTVAGEVDAVLVTAYYVNPADSSYDEQYFGFMRAPELDCVVGGAQRYGWTYLDRGDIIDGEAASNFSQVWTISEQPNTDSRIYFLDTRTGNFVEYPSATIHPVTWSAPPVMLDIEGTYSEGDDDSNIAIAQPVEEKMIIKRRSFSIDLNLRGLLTYYASQTMHYVKTFTATDYIEGGTYAGTYDFVDYDEDRNYYCKWKKQGTEDVFIYNDNRSFYEELQSGNDVYFETYDENNGWTTVAMVDHTAASPISEYYDPEVVEMICYTAWMNQGDMAQPWEVYAVSYPDYTTTARDNYSFYYDEILIDPFVKEKYYITHNAGYGETSSQTTLYSETIYRYKDFDTLAQNFKPASWENAYGAVVYANSSRDGYLEYDRYLAISPSDFFSDGQEAIILLPKTTDASVYSSSDWDMVYAYVYDATRMSIYSTLFQLSETANGVTTTYDLVSDATRNYWCTEHNCRVFHFACKQNIAYDLYTRKMDYTIDDLFFLRDGVEVYLNTETGKTHAITSLGTFPYAHFYYDQTYNYDPRCAWYDGTTVTTTEASQITFNNVTATRQTKADTTSKTLGTSVYGWEYYDGTEGWCVVYTTSFNPAVGATVYEDPEDTSATTYTVASKVATTVTWYKFFTDNFVTLTDDGGNNHSVRDAIWCSSRNYEDTASFIYSQFSISGTGTSAEVTCAPAFNDYVYVSYRYATYIAPAGEISATVDGTDVTLVPVYSDENYVYNGILYSGWEVVIGGKSTGNFYYTARITPRTTDTFYTLDGTLDPDKNEYITTLTKADITINSVTSIIDILYPNRISNE